MSTTCKICAAHARGYRLLEESERLGMRAIEATLERYMEHLRDIEAECYRSVMEQSLRGRSATEDKGDGQAQSFLKRYATRLAETFSARGCDIGLAKQEMRAWMPRGAQDYSGIRVGITLLTSDGLLKSLDEMPEALSA